MNSLARLISLLSHPIVISIPAPFLIVFRNYNGIYALKWELFSFIFIMINITYVIYGVLRGFFSDFDLTKREERKRLFAFTGLTTIVYLVFVILLRGPFELVFAISGFAAGIFIFSIINTKIKASFHVAIFTAFIFSMALFYGKIFLWGILLIPLIGWARIKTKHHKLSEVIVGGLLGGTLVILIFALSRYYST